MPESKHVGRHRASTHAIALFLCFFTIGAERLAATPPGQGQEVTTIDLGFDIVEAGAEVALPIQLKAPDGVQVGTTINEVTFPAKLLQFQEVRLGPSTEAEVTASLKEDQEVQDGKIVEVTVTARPGQILTNGIVAFVVFKVSEEVHENQLVSLKNVPRALSSGAPSNPIEPVAGRAGEIELLATAPVVIACFFYMH